MPDVEAIFIQLLSPLAKVSTKVPNPRPGTFIRSSLAGGSGDRFFDGPTLLVEAWAPNSVAASQLARDARNLLNEAQFDVVDGWQLYGIDCAYPVFFPDETSDRYQFLANVRVRRAN